jgi:hypothetical protein
MDIATWGATGLKIQTRNQAVREKPVSRVTMDSSSSDAIAVAKKATETLASLPISKGETTWRPNSWCFWAISLGLSFSMLLTELDASILTTSLLTIVANLHSGSLYIWAMNGYFLTTAAARPLAGQAADVF